MGKAARNFSLVEKVALDVPGNVFEMALALGNADNDGLGDNELVVGTLDGKLHVFKGAQRLWGDTGLGTIIGVAVGDVLNTGRNAVTVATAEGRCYVFAAEQAQPLRRVARFRIPPNVSALLVADIDADGANELVLGTTDHTLVAFVAVHTPPSLNTTAAAAAAAAAPSVAVTAPPPAYTPQLTLFAPSSTSPRSPPMAPLSPTSHAPAAASTTATATPEPLHSVGEFSAEWSLRIKREWVLEGQVESLAILRHSSGGGGSDALLVGMLCEANSPAQATYLTVTGGTVERHTIAEGCPNVVPHSKPLSTSSSSLPTAATAARANLHRKTEVIAFGDNDGTYVVSSFHGDLALKPGRWLRCWEDIPVLKAVTARDTEGKPVVIVCSWNGATHVVDADGNASRFAFGQSVRAFTAGMFSVEPGRPGLCFVYVTFHDEIVLYPNIVLKPAHLPTLVDTLADEINSAIVQLTGNTAVAQTEREELLRTLLRCPFSTSEQRSRYLSKLRSQVELLHKHGEPRSPTSAPLDTSSV